MALYNFLYTYIFRPASGSNIKEAADWWDGTNNFSDGTSDFNI